MYLIRYVMYNCIIHITYCTETCCGVLRQHIDIFDQFNLHVSTTYDIKLKDFILKKKALGSEQLFHIFILKVT